jgi:hypothetical protein
MRSALVLVVLLAAVPARAQSGAIDVRTDPAGVAVAVDGEAQGPSPLVAATTPGKHTVTLTREGYVTEKHEVVVGRGRTKLYVRLSKAGAEGLRVRDEEDPAPAPGLGLVRVTTNPPGLSVFVNDQKVERKTPVAFDVSPGNYTVVLKKREAELLSNRIEVKAGWRVQVKRDLSKAIRAAEREADRGADPDDRPARAARAPKCDCPPAKKLKNCVEKKRVCSFHAEGKGAGYALCTRCPKLKRLSKKRRDEMERACDTREGRPVDCVCGDIGRVLMHCLEPQEECLRRCRPR